MKIVLAKSSSSHPGWIMHKMVRRDHHVIVLASQGEVQGLTVNHKFMLCKHVKKSQCGLK